MPWQQFNLPQHPELLISPKEISLDKNLLYTIYSTMYLHLQYLIFGFHDAVIGVRELLWPKFFLLVDILSIFQNYLNTLRK